MLSVDVNGNPAYRLSVDKNPDNFTLSTASDEAAGRNYETKVVIQDTYQLEENDESPHFNDDQADYRSKPSLPRPSISSRKDTHNQIVEKSIRVLQPEIKNNSKFQNRAVRRQPFGTTSTNNHYKGKYYRTVMSERNSNADESVQFFTKLHDSEFVSDSSTTGNIHGQSINNCKNPFSNSQAVADEQFTVVVNKTRKGRSANKDKLSCNPVLRTALSSVKESTDNVANHEAIRSNGDLDVIQLACLNSVVNCEEKSNEKNMMYLSNNCVGQAESLPSNTSSTLDGDVCNTPNDFSLKAPLRGLNFCSRLPSVSQPELAKINNNLVTSKFASKASNMSVNLLNRVTDKIDKSVLPLAKIRALQSLTVTTKTHSCTDKQMFNSLTVPSKTHIGTDKLMTNSLKFPTKTHNYIDKLTMNSLTVPTKSHIGTGKITPNLTYGISRQRCRPKRTKWFFDTRFRDEKWTDLEQCDVSFGFTFDEETTRRYLSCESDSCHSLIQSRATPRECSQTVSKFSRNSNVVNPSLRISSSGCPSEYTFTVASEIDLILNQTPRDQTVLLNSNGGRPSCRLSLPRTLPQNGFVDLASCEKACGKFNLREAQMFFNKGM